VVADETILLRYCYLSIDAEDGWRLGIARLWICHTTAFAPQFGDSVDAR